ncbi:hypothetical protein ABZ319_08240 [Nocardia sp. NPDC005978]
MAYAVEIEVLRAPSTFAAEPQEFFDWMVQVHRSSLESEDRRTALEELFFSRPATGSEGFEYGYALKILCERFGGSLNNGHWYPVGSRGLDMIGEALAGLGVQFDPNDLAYSGSPVQLPQIDDFPAIGHLTRAEMVPLAKALEDVDLSTVEDRGVARAIAELREWCLFCTENGLDLVSFYH